MVKRIIVIITTIIISLNFTFINETGGETPPVIFKETEINYSDENFHSTDFELASNTPTVFTENVGQIPDKYIRFYDPGGCYWFTCDGIYYRLTNGKFNGDDNLRSIVLKQTFIDSNLQGLTGGNPAEWKHNFFYGNDPLNWHCNVTNYRELLYTNIYDGIDLRYYNYKNSMKYDIILNPGADPEQIRIKYNGIIDLGLDNNGNLVIENDIMDFKEKDLFIYQDEGAQIDGRFVLFDDNEFGFDIKGDYDTTKPLIIDPVISYSTYIGTSDYEDAKGIAADAEGNAYIAGFTRSPDFPTTPGAYDLEFDANNDVVVFKFDPAGKKLIYSTFIGGSNTDIANGITIDSSGYVYLVGETYSNNFPTSTTAYRRAYKSGAEVFVTKLNPTGSGIIYSTYITGDNQDHGMDIALDDNGLAYITGYSTSSDYPSTLGAFDTTTNQNDGFITKLKKDGSGLVYSTFIGGTSVDRCNGIFIDNNNCAFVTGHTSSSDFPFSPGAYRTTKIGGDDAYILKMNRNGSDIEYSTYLGGNAADAGTDIIVDSSGKAYITGYTHSINYPTTAGTYNTTGVKNRDVLITILNSMGTDLVSSTYIGGSDWDEGVGIEIRNNEVFVTGITYSSDFPTTQDSINNSFLGVTDLFLLTLNNDFSKLKFSTFLGGPGIELCSDMVLDVKGDAYISGNTNSDSFYVTKGAYDPSFNGDNDIFVMKVGLTPYINITSDLINITNPEPVQVYSEYRSYNFKVRLLNSGPKFSLKSVLLTLDPDGSEVKVIWNNLTKKFNEFSDANGYISIDPSSNYFFSGYEWTIDFNITFDWSYPDENIHGISAVADYSLPIPVDEQVDNFYRVENDLDLIGSLIVRGEDARAIGELDIVRGGEDISLTGILTTYEGTTDKFPIPGEYSISLKKGTNLIGMYTPDGTSPFNIDFKAPADTNQNGIKYNLSIDKIPVGNDVSDVSFTVRVDGDDVIFSDPLPEDNSWVSDRNINASITITDIGGSKVNGSNIMYSTSTDNGVSWQSWQKISDLDSDETLRPAQTVTFAEGKNNLIKWKSTDIVGNGPAESREFGIFVDTEDIFFSDPLPQDTFISPTESVEVGITISDNTSGVNASTVKYSVSYDSGKTWSQWISTYDLVDGPVVKARLNITFNNGTGNMIKWRAMDIAGNGPKGSSEYIVKVDVSLNKPKVLLLSPENGLIINKNTVTLEWKLITPNLPQITYDIYFGTSTPLSEYRRDYTGNKFEINDLADGKFYYWNVVPKLGNGKGECISGTWMFKIDLSATQTDKGFKLDITGIDKITILPGEKKSTTLKIKNLGLFDDRVNIFIEDGGLSEFAKMDDYSTVMLRSGEEFERNLKIELPQNILPGLYMLNISASSLNGGKDANDLHIIIVEVVTEYPDNINQRPDSKSNLLLISTILAVVIILIIIIIVFILHRKKSRRDKQGLQSEVEVPDSSGRTLVAKPGYVIPPTIDMEQVPKTEQPLQFPQGQELSSLPPTTGYPQDAQNANLQAPVSQSIEQLSPVQQEELNVPSPTHQQQPTAVPGTPTALPEVPEQDKKQKQS